MHFVRGRCGAACSVETVCGRGGSVQITRRFELIKSNCVLRAFPSFLVPRRPPPQNRPPPTVCRQRAGNAIFGQTSESASWFGPNHAPFQLGQVESRASLAAANSREAKATTKKSTFSRRTAAAAAVEQSVHTNFGTQRWPGHCCPASRPAQNNFLLPEHFCRALRVSWKCIYLRRALVWEAVRRAPCAVRGGERAVLHALSA